jgi:hypothetical protein
LAGIANRDVIEIVEFSTQPVFSRKMYLGSPSQAAVLFWEKRRMAQRTAIPSPNHQH